MMWNEFPGFYNRASYLNGGLFLRHQIEERHGEQIAIPDRAFERLFGFFDQYHWHLDDRPLRDDNEINPDVLDFIINYDIKYRMGRDGGAGDWRWGERR